MLTIQMPPRKNSRPDANQLMAVMLAKAADIPVPERVKKYAHLVKKARKSPKKRA